MNLSYILNQLVMFLPAQYDVKYILIYLDDILPIQMGLP